MLYSNVASKIYFGLDFCWKTQLRYVASLDDGLHDAEGILSCEVIGAGSDCFLPS